MNSDFFIGSKLVNDLAWTLIDSLWQITLVTAALWLVLALTRSMPASFRYVCCLAALFICFAVPVITFVSRVADTRVVEQFPGQSRSMSLLGENAGPDGSRGESKTPVAMPSDGPAAQLITSVS